MRRGEIEDLINDSFPFSSHYDDEEDNGPDRKPPVYLLYVGLVSVLSGFAVGVYGLKYALTDTQQFITGGIGYILCTVVPIALLLFMIAKHEAARRELNSGRYDSMGGNKLLRKFRNFVVFAGLITAALPIWVLLTPIAQSI